VVACLGPRRLLDAVSPELPGAWRTAVDELLLIGWEEPAESLLDAGGSLLGLEGVAVDVSSAWRAWTLAGEQVDHALARLSALAAPAERPALVQGRVAEIPAKVLWLEAEAHVLVPAELGHHLRARVLAACGDLDVVERPAATRGRVAAETP
jgi:hypothetical protein